MTLATVGAEAATIEMAPSGASTFTMTCPSGCVGLVGSPLASTSATGADGYEIDPASDVSIAAALSALPGLTGGDVFVAADVEKTVVPKDMDDEPSYVYSVLPGYFFAKYACFTSFFYTDTAQDVTFEKTGRGKGNLSNYGTVAVDPAPVPLPAAGWLLLAGLAGMAALRRRA